MKLLYLLISKQTGFLIKMIKKNIIKQEITFKRKGEPKLQNLLTIFDSLTY